VVSQPDIGEFVIVLRGKFDPAPFQPRWFADHKLLREEEVANPQLHVFHTAIVAFSVAWLSVHIEQDRFQVGTTEEAYLEPLRDVMLGVLEIVEKADPLLLGMNRLGHYRLGSRREMDRIGYHIVPKGPWENLLTPEGMTSATVQGRRPDSHKGFIRVKVEPSVRVEHGVYVDVNDHYDLHEEAGAGERGKLAHDILSALWTTSQARSQKITETVLAWGAS
jgi:hypothetical protein